MGVAVARFVKGWRGAWGAHAGRPDFQIKKLFTGGPALTWPKWTMGWMSAVCRLDICLYKHAGLQALPPEVAVFPSGRWFCGSWSHVMCRSEGA